MKNSATILADAPTASLKLAYSYLIPDLYFPSGSDSEKHNSKRPSPYKSLFVVDPAINVASSWDVEWFNNYE